MVFARKIWKLLVAVKDALALLFLLLFFLMLYAILTARPTAGSVHEGALLLQLDGAIVEEPAAVDPVALLLSSRNLPSQYRARDIVRALRTAAKDNRIKAVVLDLSRFAGGGMVHLQEVGAALDQVRAAGKPVLAYAPIYIDDRLLLAAHASEVWVDPLGGAFIVGPGVNQLYYGRLLDKLKVTAHVFRVGTFKSAVEPFMRNDQSPEARMASQALYGALWTAWKADVTKARPKVNIAMATGDPAGWLKTWGGDAAKAAQVAGLVDRIGDSVEFGQRVAQLVGADKADKSPGSFAHSSLEAWLAANSEKTPGKEIGVITIAGEIVDGNAGPGVAGGDRIVGLLDDALEKNFAALVVRVDSPGGSIMASEKIRRAIERYKAKHIPVVVSMANMGASGGYWVSTPGSRIFAEPATITGSIGVFAVIPSFERALSDWGVTSDGVKTTPLTGQLDFVGGLSPDTATMIQSNIEYDYARFIGLVATARGKSVRQVDAIGQGRVWDGGTARQLGLVDQFGGLDEALAYAAKSAKLGEGKWHPVFLGGEGESLSALLQQMRRARADTVVAGDWAAIAADRQQGMIGAALVSMERLTSTRGVQAYCLECPVQPVAVSHGQGAVFGLLARMVRVFEGG